MKIFDEYLLRKQLGELPPGRQILFAAIVAARMSAAYRLYCQRRQIGNDSCFQSALHFVWEQLSTATLDREGAETYLAEVMELIPEEDSHWGPFSAQADDAASALAYALRCLIDPKPEEAAWAARRAYESADNLVFQASDVKFEGSREAAITASPLVQSELGQQTVDLATAKIVVMSVPELKNLMTQSIEQGSAFFSKVWPTSDSSP